MREEHSPGGWGESQRRLEGGQRAAGQAPPEADGKQGLTAPPSPQEDGSPWF